MKHLLLILTLSATVMLTGLGASRLWDDDEPRNAGCAREMLARWDWIVPWFNNELRAHKPVLTYWCIMASYLVLGESEFSARLPSALAAVGTTLLTYAIGRRLLSKDAALWAALILPTTMLFAMAGRIATPDSLLIFCVTLTMAIFVWTAWPAQGGGEENHETHERHETVAAAGAKYFPRQWWKVALIHAAMGLAVLAKGPVGVLLPTAILGMFLLIVWWKPVTFTQSASEGRIVILPRLRFGLVRIGRLITHILRTAWSMRPLTALAMVALVAGPWYLAVGYRTDWQFLEEFFVKHNLQRATGAMEGHTGGIWFYPATLLVGFFPWSIFAIPMGLEVATAVRRDCRQRMAVLFLLCWTGVWLGAFSLAGTKLPSYATPCFPAVALLTGYFVERLLRGELASARFWPVISFGCLTTIGLGMAIGLPLAARRFVPGEEWLGILGVAPILGGIGGLLFWTRHNPKLALSWMVASAATTVLGVFAVGAQAVDRHQQVGRVLAVIHQADEQPEVASYKILEPSWVYYGRIPIRELRESPAEAADFLAGGPKRLLITTQKHWGGISRRGVPADIVILARASHFLNDDELVLVGRSNAEQARKFTTQR